MDRRKETLISQSENEAMRSAGFEWDPTDAGYPRWIHRAKNIYCVRPLHMNDEEWKREKKKKIFQSTLELPPSFFAGLGQPCCSRWGNSESEWIAQAYVQALANGGDVWRRLSRQETYDLLTEEQRDQWGRMLKSDFYDRSFQMVANRIVSCDGAFSVEGFWHRGRASS